MDNPKLLKSYQIAKKIFWSIPGRIALALVFSLGLGYVAIRGLDWGDVGEAFRGFNVWAAILGLVLFNAATILRAYRWQVLFLGERVSLWRLFMVQNTGIGLNNLSPVRVVSEPMQFVMLTARYGLRGGSSAATLAMERVLDMVSSTALLAVALIFIQSKGDMPQYLLAAFVIAVISVALTVFFAKATRWPIVTRTAVLRSFSDAVAQLWKAPGVLGYSLFLSILYWIAVGFCTWIVSLGMPELSISPLVATLAILGTLYLTTSLPSLPMAVGTFEAAIQYVLMEFFGAGKAVAFSYAVIIHAMLYLPPTIIAIVVMSVLGLRPRRIMQGGVSVTSSDPSDTDRDQDE
jgi:uncharacterized membrane protein YbhN (UPF0104 family)